MERENPISIHVLKQLDWSRFESKFEDLHQQITAADDARQNWLRECNEIYAMLRGEDKRHNKPWKDASELSIPLIAKMLRRVVPKIYSLFADRNPLMNFYVGRPEDAENATNAEEFFTWLVRVYMDGTFREMALHATTYALLGQSYIGVHWDYRTRNVSRVVVASDLWPNGVPKEPEAVKQALITQYDLRPDIVGLEEAVQQLLEGAPYVRITNRRVLADKPVLRWYHPRRVIVPPHSEACENAEWICLVHTLRLQQIREMARDGFFDPVVAEKMFSEINANAEEEEEGERKDQEDRGVYAQRDKDKVTLYQVYCLLDIDGDGVDERVVLWYSPVTKHRLAFHRFPFSFDHWPVFRADFETLDRRPYISRGIGQYLKDIQKQYNKEMRATADAIDIQLAPVFLRKVTGKLMPRTFTWGPAKVIPVTTDNEIQMMEKSVLNLHQYLQSRTELEAFAEDLIGSLETSLVRTGRRIERRSATEVSQLAGIMQSIDTMDQLNFLEHLSHVYQTIWQMWLDLGPNEIYYHVLGQTVPKVFVKAEQHYRFRLVPLDEPLLSRNTQLQALFQVAQFAAQLAPQKIDWDFVIRRIVQLLLPRYADRIVLPLMEQQGFQAIERVAQEVLGGTAEGAAT